MKKLLSLIILLFLFVNFSYAQVEVTSKGVSGNKVVADSANFRIVIADSIQTYLLRVFNISDTTYTVVYDTAGSFISQGYIVCNGEVGILKDTLIVSSNELIPSLCWYSNEASLNTCEVIHFAAVPSGFPGFDATSADSAVVIPIVTKSTSAANNTIDVYAYDASDSTSSTVVTGGVSGSAWTLVDVDMAGDRAVLASISNITVMAVKVKYYSKDGNRAIARNFVRFNW